jgi:hypothetical protein
MPLKDLVEREGHAAADDDLVGLLEQVVDEGNLVGDLGAAEDGEQRAGRGLDDLGEGLELGLHQETGGLQRQRHADHRAVRGGRCRKRR